MKSSTEYQVPSTKIILSVVCSLSFAAGVSYAEEEITLLYTGQTHAMLYPCHCPKEPDGGIARRTSLVKTLKKRFPQALLLDSGGFFAGGPLDQYSLGDDLDKERTRLNLKAMALMQYDAAVIGVDEFNFGQEFLEKSTGNVSIAFLSCNIKSREMFLPYIIKQIGGTKIGILGVTTPAVMPKMREITLVTPKVAVAQTVKELRQKGCDLIVLLSTLLENEELDLIENIPGIDVLITYNIAISTAADMPVEPSSIKGSTLILRPSWQGRRLGRVSLMLKDKRIIDHKVEELRLSDEIAGDPGVLAFLPQCFSDNDCRKAGFQGRCQDPGSLGSRCEFSELSPVNLTVITTKSCVTCNTEQALQRIKQWFPGLVVSYLYYPEAQAQNLIRDFGIDALPAYLLGKEAEKEKAFIQLSLDKNSERKGDFYMLSPQLIGLTYLLNRKAIKGKLDLFISFFDGQSKELLDAVNVFTPNVHFLAKEELEGFEAAGGNLEVEEYLRAVCVQKYYPQAFWNYISCRAGKSKSSWWEDCAFSLDIKKIKTCAQGTEGRDLLRENTKLNKELGIMFGPTYLLRNQEIFGSQGVPSREELKNIISKEER
jgi:hypothetical protein